MAEKGADRLRFSRKLFRLFLRRGRLVTLFLLAAALLLTLLFQRGKALSAESADDSLEGEIFEAEELLALEEAKSALPASSDEDGSAVRSEGEKILETAAVSAPSGEMRAVWIPCMTLTGLDTEEKFTAKFREILETALRLRLNTLIVQVRPFADALYRSKLYPFSHVLTGEQGKDPGFDPLEIMTSLAHEAGLALHAWVNPLRISSARIPENFAENSPCMLWKEDETKRDYLMEYEGAYYMNPAYEEVRRFIIEGVAEIVRDYAVDGIQFDDYFYPAEDAAIDESAYQSYIYSLESALPLHEWRKQNINTLIAGVYAAVKKENPIAVFGISPQGNFENDERLCADVAVWGAVSGYVDYLCPQLYVGLHNTHLPFSETALRWRETVCSETVKLYLGLGVYKAGSDEEDGAWQESDEILATELTVGREAQFDGFMLYSYDSLLKEEAAAEVENLSRLIL